MKLIAKGAVEGRRIPDFYATKGGEDVADLSRWDQDRSLFWSLDGPGDCPPGLDRIDDYDRGMYHLIDTIGRLVMDAIDPEG